MRCLFAFACAMLLAPLSARAQVSVRDTTVMLPAQGEVVKAHVGADVLAVRLESPDARVTAGATYSAVRLRVRWSGAAGMVRVRAAVPPELTRLFPSSVSQPR